MSPVPPEHAILVTGGAGYIGSHVVHQLTAAGRRVVVLDNLSTGRAESVIGADLVLGDTGDRDLVSKLMAEREVGAVLHFAARLVVPESVNEPLLYYGNNTCASRNLMECAVNAGVEHFIFSSTAAVYGIPSGDSAREDTPTNPINPYGRSKLMTEWMLADTSAARALRYVVLRYFNVAGADPGGRLGQCTPGATHLIKVACEAACGKRKTLSVFGTDYPTPDGTGVRDYIHVDDLARAHLDALSHLESGGESCTLNCGYGHGYSVREVIRMVEKVSGSKLEVLDEARRPGDPPSLVAVADRIREVLGWQPQLDDLELIVRTAYDFERRIPAAWELPRR